MEGGAAQLLQLGAALADIRRRSSDELRGGKRLWTATSFINLTGPVAPFLIGRNL